MKILIQIFVIAIFALIAQLILPWWGVILAAAAGGFAISQKGAKVFIAGFLGVSLLWLLQTWLVDSANNSILSDKVAGIFGLSSGFMMILITALIGGLCGGFGAMLGRSLRELM